MTTFILPDTGQRVSRLIASRPIVDVSGLCEAGFTVTVGQIDHGTVSGALFYSDRFFAYLHRIDRNDGSEMLMTYLHNWTECQFTVDTSSELHIKHNGKWYVLDYAGLLAYAGGRR